MYHIILNLAYSDAKYNIWRRVVFETIPDGRDFPLILPDDLIGALYDE